MSLRISSVLGEAQGGQTYANLARAFHLPPEKVQKAVEDMLEPLITDIGQRLPSRRALAELVELLGKSDYERVLETPMLLGATHTQVLGSEALAVIAGRKESNRLVRHAATVADVSEMIAEYLLPVVAAMLIGALAKACRPELEQIMGHVPSEGEDPPHGDPPLAAYDLPRVSGGVGFTGSTGGTLSVPGPIVSESRYIEFADEIRRGSAADPAEAVRRVLAPALDLPFGTISWLRRFGSWSTSTFNAALANLRR